MNRFDKAIGFGFALLCFLIVGEAVTACSSIPKQRMQNCTKVGEESGKSTWDCEQYTLPKNTTESRR